MAWNGRRRGKGFGGIVLMTVASACGSVMAVSTAAGSLSVAPVGVNRINHVVVVMQENRSYDSYIARLHYQGQPASPVEPLGGNPNPTGGPRIHPFLKTTE